MKDHLMNAALLGFALIGISLFFPPRSAVGGTILVVGMVLATMGLAAAYERR